MNDFLKITPDTIHRMSTPQSFSRGQEYSQKDSIFDTTYQGNTLEGYCRGSEDAPYHIRVSVEHGEISSTTCTCPYDRGGLCKHTVALLLTYISDAKRFVDMRAKPSELENRSKEDLINLINQMVKRHPDLRSLIDRPTPQASTDATPKPINVKSIEKELEKAFGYHSRWDAYNDDEAVHPVATINSIINTARQFETNQDWKNARLIYSTIIANVITEDLYEWDYDGDIGMAMETIAERLQYCVDQPIIGDDDIERRAALSSLFSLITTDIELGGRDFGGDVEPMFLSCIRSSDIGLFRERIQQAMGEANNLYSSWSTDYYSSLLNELDLLDNVDPEIILDRLRDGGRDKLLCEKLIDLERFDEVVSILEKGALYNYEQINIIDRLSRAGHQDSAVRLAQNILEKEFDYHASEWLGRIFTEQNNREGLLSLRHQKFLNRPDEHLFQEIKTLAEALDQWDTLRSELLNWLKENQRFGLITEIHLTEEAWEAAWQSLEKAQKLHRYGWGLTTLEFSVAEKTRFINPEKSLAIFLNRVKELIDARGRESYKLAAEILIMVRELYHHIEKTDDSEQWNTLIKQLRTDHKRLSALQDELKKAGL